MNYSIYFFLKIRYMFSLNKINANNQQFLSLVYTKSINNLKN